MNPLEPHTGRGPMSRPAKPMTDPNQRLPALPNGVPMVTDAPQGDPPGLSAPPTMASLFQAFRRRWPLALGLGVLGAVLGVGAVLLLFPAKFTAFALVDVASQPDPFVLSDNRPDEDFLLFKAKMQSFPKSPVILNAAMFYDPEVKDLAIVREPGFIEWLEANIKTDFLRGPEFMKIALGMDDPDEAARIVNAIARAFLKEIEQRDRRKRQEVLTELLSSYSALEQKLNQKRTELRAKQIEFGIEDVATLQTKYTSAINELANIRTKEREARIERHQSEEKIKALEEKVKDKSKLFVPPEKIDEYFEQMPEVLALFTQKGVIGKKIIDIKNAAPNAENLIRQEQTNLDRVNRDINALRERSLPAVVANLQRKIHGEMVTDIMKLRDNITSLKDREEKYAQEIKNQDELVKNLNPASRPETLDISTRRDEITRMEAAQLKLNESIAKIQLEPTASRVHMLQQASPPSSRDVARQVRMAGVAGFGMFGLLLFGVSWWEFRARRISATEEVVHGLGLSLVGTLPAIPDRPHKPGANGSTSKDLYWQSQLSEAVDSIRTMLLHVSRKEELKVVMITSAVSGEGKTSLASQLAASLARAWRKTLLIDGDLRNPSAHNLFELPQEPGLSEVLRGDVQVADTIKPTLLSRLWLMPAGHWDSHAVQALAQDGAKNILHELKGQYDFIIVDSSPVLPVADTLLLAQHVDAALVSILRDVSRMPAVYATQQRLANLGVRVLGAVVLGTSNEAGYMGYGSPVRAG